MREGCGEATLGKEGEGTMTTPLLGDPSSQGGGGMKKKSSGGFLGKLGSMSNGHTKFYSLDTISPFNASSLWLVCNNTNNQ